MITVITGLTGSGKTWFMTRLIHKEWKAGAVVNVNFPVYFSAENENINRWHQLDELYHLHNGIIAIDEGQKLFDARRWGSLPLSFSEQIASQRHRFLDIYTTTQDLGHIDLRVRSNIHELYNCRSIFRFPKNERTHPILQLIIITKKIRSLESEQIRWTSVSNSYHWISKFFTKELYNTYASIDLQRFLCRIKFEKKIGQKQGKWIGKIYSRDLVNRGRARL